MDSPPTPPWAGEGFGPNVTLQERGWLDVRWAAEEAYWVLGRVGCFLSVVLVVAVCIFACWHRRKMNALTQHQSTRCWHQLKHHLYNCLCCGFCCPSLHAEIAPDYMRPTAPQTLRITLLKAKNMRQRCNFYLEAFTEPMESRPKTSRVHHQVVAGCDLGGEVLELDWYGDESSLVVQAVEYKAKEVTADKGLGELRLPREVVDRYAAEAATGSTDLVRGARLFSFRPLSAQAARQRKQRFVPPSAMTPLNQVVLPGIIKKLQEQSGNEPEVDRLQEEVRMLKEQNAQLTSGAREVLTATQSSGKIGGAAREVAMSVAMRLEFDRPRHCPDSPEVMRSASFEEDEEGGSQTALLQSRFSA